MRSSKIQTFGLLVVIIVGAFLLRSYSLPDRGIQFLDETIYYGQPASMATHIRWWMSGEGANLSVDQQRLSLMRAIEKVRGLPGGWLTDKPFYGLMAVIIYTLFGPSPSPFLIINAFLGATTAGLVYFLGRKLGQDKVAALFSAIALALSGFHMLWSRTGFTHVSATFFLTLGLLSYAHTTWSKTKHPSRWLLAAGICLGAGTGSHIVSSLFAGACFFTEAYRSIQQKKYRQGLINLALLGAGTGIVLIGLHILTWWTGNTISSSFPWLYGENPTSYFAGLFHHKLELNRHQSSGVFYSPGLMTSALLRMPFLYGEGVFYSSIFLIGLAATIVRFLKKWRDSDLFILIGVLIPILIISTIRLLPLLPRNLSPMAPFSALFVGSVLAFLWNRAPSKALRWALVGIFTVIQLSHSAYLFGIHSGYAGAATWLSQNGNEEATLLTEQYRSRFWYVNGVKNVYFMGQDKTGRKWAKKMPWENITEIPDKTRKQFAGIIGSEVVSMPDSLKIWPSRLERNTPEARFTNTRSFTIKKLEIIQGILGIARLAGLNSLVKRMEFELAKERRVEKREAVSLYRLLPRK